jgi:hypothetical protein
MIKQYQIPSANAHAHRRALPAAVSSLPQPVTLCVVLEN